MVQLLKNDNGGSDWKGWALSIAVLIIAGLASILSGLSVSLIKDFRNEFITETREHKDLNHRQDLEIAELKLLSSMTYEERIKCLQSLKSMREKNK